MKAMLLVAHTGFRTRTPVNAERGPFSGAFLAPVPANLLRDSAGIFLNENGDIFEFHPSLQRLLNVDSV